MISTRSATMELRWSLLARATDDAGQSILHLEIPRRSDLIAPSLFPRASMRHSCKTDPHGHPLQPVHPQPLLLPQALPTHPDRSLERNPAAAPEKN
jgi:hypothetical protein